MRAYIGLHSFNVGKKIIVQSPRIKILKLDVYVLVLANENHGLERKISPEKLPADGAVQRYDLKGKSRKQTLGAVRE